MRKCGGAAADGCGPGCVRVASGACESNQSHFAEYYQQVFDHRSIAGPEIGAGYGAASPNGSLSGGVNEALWVQHLRYILSHSPDPTTQIEIMSEVFLTQQEILCGKTGGRPAPVFSDANFTVRKFD